MPCAGRGALSDAAPWQGFTRSTHAWASFAGAVNLGVSFPFSESLLQVFVNGRPRQGHFPSSISREGAWHSK